MDLYKQQLNNFNKKYEVLLETLNVHFIELYKNNLEPLDNIKKQKNNNINSKLLEILKMMIEIENNIDDVILEIKTETPIPKTQEDLEINKTISDFTPLLFFYMMTLKEKNNTETTNTTKKSSYTDID